VGLKSRDPGGENHPAILMVTDEGFDAVQHLILIITGDFIHSIQQYQYPIL
jgi:hypothetical protein